MESKQYCLALSSQQSSIPSVLVFIFVNFSACLPQSISVYKNDKLKFVVFLLMHINIASCL